MRKILILSLVIFLFSCSSSLSEEIRRPAVAGAFYPGNKEVLRKTIKGFLADVERHEVEGKILAILVPHAGYVYSGQIAAYSYKQLEGHRVNSVVLICNSHAAYFSGIAIDGRDAWQTPLGSVDLDKDLADKLVMIDELVHYDSTVHERDHTLEVQLPFLQTALKGDFKIVPMLFGNTPDRTYKKLARALAENLGKDDIVIISTDMSHYPDYEDANSIDPGMLEIIKEKNVAKIEEYIGRVKSQGIPGVDTLCCGIDGIKTVVELCNIWGSEIEILKYANSGDVEIGDKSRVVGYASAIIYKPSASKREGKDEGAITMKDEYLNKDEV